jgi:hypothetical protein
MESAWSKRTKVSANPISSGTPIEDAFETAAGKVTAPLSAIYPQIVEGAFTSIKKTTPSRCTGQQQVISSKLKRPHV